MPTTSNGNLSNNRFTICTTFASLAFLVIAIHLFNLQIINSEKYKALAAAQHEQYFSTAAKRGTIYSSDNFPLSIDKPKWLLYAEPQRIDNAEVTGQILCNALSMECVDTVAKLSEDLQWVSLGIILDASQKEQIDSLSLQGIGFEEQKERYYPEDLLAREVLGFVGKNTDGKEQGYFGLEGYYNDDLLGRDGWTLEYKSALGEPILSGDYRSIPVVAGRDLILTINRDVQFLVEKKLSKAIIDYGAESGTVIVMDPLTGGILAMADSPKQATPSAFSNKSISVTYEPGSVMKAVTMAAAINEGIVEPTTTMIDDGPKVYSGHTINNWDGKHHGEETMVEILQHSNNIGAAWVGDLLGASKLYEYILKFGFGRGLSIDLEGEASGNIRPLEEWGDIERATASFGQGISVTPLQMLSAFATIANNGVYKKPYLVQAIIDRESDKNSYYAKNIKGEKVLKEDKAEVMIEMLTKAVSEGEGKFSVFKNYKVAGKTGTAQIPVDGRYDPTKTNATFIGFLPTSKKFAMLVKLEKPTSSYWASETAEPLWMSIAQDLIYYYDIKPDY